MVIYWRYVQLFCDQAESFYWNQFPVSYILRCYIGLIRLENSNFGFTKFKAHITTLSTTKKSYFPCIYD